MSFEGPLGRRVPEPGSSDDAILDAFLGWVTDEGLSLYPAQEEAILELFAGKNVILATPTGSGKSMVALAAHFRALARAERSYYTAPIKALANEKFFDLVRLFSPEWVGISTGDASVNGKAWAVCCTAEILANIGLAEGAAADVGAVIIDEFHYYSDRERGWSWQVPLLTLPQAQFLLMSATLGDTTFFEKELTRLTGRETVTIRSDFRPVPLDFTYKETPLHETVNDLLKAGKSPVYLVNFTQRACAEEAQNLMSIDVCSKEEKKKIAEALVGVHFESPYGRELQRFLRHGIGIHHAGLLPRYRLLVEKLAQKGLLKVISGTDTLGVGVNVPIRTVLFTKLCKFDGDKTVLLPVRDFRQIAGRAGRKGFDVQGSVVAQAPEHVIENLRLEAKVLSDPSKKKKLVRKKPPEWGYVAWDKAVFERLQTAPCEALTSRFKVTHGMILDVLSRPTGNCFTLGRIIRRSQGRPTERKVRGRTAQSMIHSLVEAGVVVVAEDRTDGSKRLVVDAELQRDFSLMHAQALFLLDVVKKMQGGATREPTTSTATDGGPTPASTEAAGSENYAVDLLAAVESICEDPDAILRKQVEKRKSEKVAELKAAGVEYEERMAELEKVTYDRPQAQFLWAEFDAFVLTHPWLAGEKVRPKGIAREMIEGYWSFAEYVRHYELQRSEGLLLRYLSEVVKVLTKTIPDADKDESVREIEEYFRAMVTATDASLLDEWERMQRPDAWKARAVETEEKLEPEGSADITRDRRTFQVLVKNAVFQIVRALAACDYAHAVELTAVVEGAEAWTVKRYQQAMDRFYDSGRGLLIDPSVRGPNYVQLATSGPIWTGAQLLEGERTAANNGAEPGEEVTAASRGPSSFSLRYTVDLERSKERGRPEIVVIALDDDPIGLPE